MATHTDPTPKKCEFNKENKRMFGRLRHSWRVGEGWRELRGGWLQVFLYKIVIAILVGKQHIYNPTPNKPQI